MQKEKILFMAGLPRSGSTLLAALLNQNPRIHTEPSSPLMDLSKAVVRAIESNEHYTAFPKPKSALAVSQAVFQAYYWEAEKPVIIDKNRGWPTQIRGLEQCIVPKAKIICPVRDIDEVLASLVKIARENPFNPETGRLNFIDHSLVAMNKPINDDNRCEFLLSTQGILGQCAVALQNAIKEGFRDRLHFVEYNDLVEEPEETLRELYAFLEEEEYEGHDFSNIQGMYREKDSEVFSVPDLHKVSEKLIRSKTNPKKILPSKFYSFCQGKEFWRTLEEG
jgi:sulfotransferase